MPPSLRRVGHRVVELSRGRLGVAGALVLLVVVRLPFLMDPPSPDEGGFLLVAEQWHLDDDGLYGAYWVDRPPLLLLLFKVPAALGGVTALRLLGMVAAAALVMLAAAVGRQVAGRDVAGWCALVAAGLSSSYATGGHLVDGELLAVPLVLAGCLASLLALDAAGIRGGRAWAWSALAGTTGAAAVLIKQNFVDGLVFAGVLLLVAALADRGPSRRHVAKVAAGVMAGALLVLGAVAGWAVAAGPGLGRLAYGMYGFRLDAAEAIAGSDQSRPMERLGLLVLAAVLSGMVPILVLALRDVTLPLTRADPVSWAFVGMLVVGVAGVAAGGSFWRHYLIALVPATVIGVALMVRHRPGVRWLPWLVGLTVLSVLVTAAGANVVHAFREDPQERAMRAALWLREHAAPGDTAVVTYGHANTLLEAGMASPYPYLWSLPVRVRDPELDLLADTLAGPDAPDWVVEWDDVDTWGLDENGRVRAVLEGEYEVVAERDGIVFHRRR